jgi:uncharacterized membrane protein
VRSSGLTLGGWTMRRWLSLSTGAGMVTAAALTAPLYFAARYPGSRTALDWCGAVPLLDCERAVLSGMAAVAGVPLAWFGVLLGGLVVLGALLPSISLERTNRALALLNAVAVVALFFHATLVLNSLCLLCSIYGGFSIASAALFLRWQDTEAGSPFMPAPAHVAVIGLIAAAGGWSFAEYHRVVRAAEAGAGNMRAVAAFYSLPQVNWPSEISPYWTLRAAADFEAAPIRIVEYADLLCIDCRVFHEQLRELEREFAGRINMAYQFFPLEAKCNDVVAKDKHPGSCDLAYMAASDPAKFRAIHDEVIDNMDAARDAAWQVDLGRRFGVEAALRDTALQARVHRLIRTGSEYEQTSGKWEHGIRSTPTIIINNRMIIGTIPTEQLRAIFRALVDEHTHGGARFLENWLDPGCVLEAAGGPPQPCGT